MENFVPDSNPSRKDTESLILQQENEKKNSGFGFDSDYELMCEGMPSCSPKNNQAKKSDSSEFKAKALKSESGLGSSSDDSDELEKVSDGAAKEGTGPIRGNEALQALEKVMGSRGFDGFRKCMIHAITKKGFRSQSAALAFDSAVRAFLSQYVSPKGTHWIKNGEMVPLLLFRMAHKKAVKASQNEAKLPTSTLGFGQEPTVSPDEDENWNQQFQIFESRLKAVAPAWEAFKNKLDREFPLEDENQNKNPRRRAFELLFCRKLNPGTNMARLPLKQIAESVGWSELSLKVFKKTTFLPMFNEFTRDCLKLAKSLPNLKNDSDDSDVGFPAIKWDEMDDRDSKGGQKRGPK